MIYSLKDIIITAPFLGDECHLDGILSRHINLVYGMNGSGKSTLTSAISDLASGRDNGTCVKFNAELSEEEKKNIFIFNEKYLRNNIEIDDDGLNSILTVGTDDINLKKEISDLNKKIEEASKDKEKQERSIEEASPAFAQFEKKITDRLNDAQLSYATRLRDAESRKNKTRVTISEITDHLTEVRAKYDSKITLQEAIEKVNSLITLLANSKKGKPIDNWNPRVIDSEYIKNTVIPLISETVHKPDMSERDKYIISLIQNQVDVLGITKAHITEPGLSFCPFCQQEISPEHLDGLKDNVSQIEQMLHDKSKDFIRRVESASRLLESVVPDIDSDAFPDGFFGQNISSMQMAAQSVSTEMEKLSSMLEKRRLNPYASCDIYDVSAFDDAVASYNEAIEETRQTIDRYNSSLLDQDKNKQEFDSLNYWLAYHENADLFTEYFRQKEILETAEEKKAQDDSSISTLRKSIETLNAQASNAKFAMEEINRGLHYIYMAKDRLSIEPFTEGSQVKYRLKSHGTSVRPDRISEGERNAIGLAYFFASAQASLEKKNISGRASLFVVDDPISSFDRGTRIGIISFLREKFSNIFNDGESKILVLSHDIHTINDLADASFNIACEHRFPEDEINEMKEFPALELNRGRLLPFSKNYNNYRNLLADVYKFAAASEEDHYQREYSIGNDVRKLLEAYSSFTYGMGVSQMLVDRDILRLIPTEEARQFFTRLSVMPFLNGESHPDIRNDSIDPDSSPFMELEKRQTIKYLFAFINLTSPLHLEKNLMKESRERYIALENVKQWTEKLTHLVPHSERSRGNQDNDIYTLINTYQDAMFEVERDREGNLHCGECMIPYSSGTELVNKRVRLTDVKRNYKRTSDRYPLFSHCARVD